MKGRKSPGNPKFAIAAALFLLAAIAAIIWYVWPSPKASPFANVSTIAGLGSEFGEPFGIAAKSGAIYVSDGQEGKIWRIEAGKLTVFADGFDTPSGIVFDKNGHLIVVDSGSQTIKTVDANGSVSLLAGIDGRYGNTDGDAATALFNAPIGIAAALDGKIFVADTYNDRIRLIENGKVSTVAGSDKGFADGAGGQAKFDTPTGLAFWQDRLLVADTGNHRVRVVEPDGRVWTLAGMGDADVRDGSPLSAAFYQPTAVAVSDNRIIYVADGNTIRKIGGGAFTYVSTLSSQDRGLADGLLSRTQFNRPSGLSFDTGGNLIVADSENRLVRRISSKSSGHEIKPEEIAALRDQPENFRKEQPARWPYDPPTAKRDVAGTLGEVRGEVTDGSSQVWFHNGLDIAGSYGETARFIREEKVLKPIAAENFGTLRELIRMPTLGYIHIRLGRNQNSEPFGDARFRFERDTAGRLAGVRVPRGARFKAGDPIGTLNAMNHVHLIAGRTGSEMNALDALILPGITDSRPPVIEKVTFYDQNWVPVETVSQKSRIMLPERTRIVVRTFDQVDDNSERRRLGVYKLGYQLLNTDKTPISDTRWTISFDRMPSNEAVKVVYARDSHSGATGETIFNYIVTNYCDAGRFGEGFLNTGEFAAGVYVLRVFATDYFGNTSSDDIEFEVIK